MKNKGENKCCASQLRYDVISRDWVVVAPGRGKRPEAFKKERVKSEIDPKECVFCRLDNADFLFAIAGGKKFEKDIPKNWDVAAIANKFPAFCAIDKPKICWQKEGELYRTMDAAGFCEVIITRDHYKHIALLGAEKIKEIIDTYQARFLALKKNRFVKYVSVFHNHGVEAGASQPHPHSQIITTPLVDTDLREALANYKKYWRGHKKCLSCAMTEWELKNGARLVCENKDFAAVCPFASKAAFEVVISPKKHLPYFETITEPQKKSLAQIFSAVMKKIYSGLNDPPYNFYLHTAPSDGRDYPYYHWHFTIVPKINIAAGFEMNARMEIVPIAPEDAAAYLRAQSIG